MPLRILALGLDRSELVNADVFLLTDDQPKLLAGGRGSASTAAKRRIASAAERPALGQGHGMGARLDVVLVPEGRRPGRAARLRPGRSPTTANACRAHRRRHQRPRTLGRSSLPSRSSVADRARGWRRARGVRVLGASAAVRGDTTHGNSGMSPAHRSAVAIAAAVATALAGFAMATATRAEPSSRLGPGLVTVTSTRTTASSRSTRCTCERAPRCAS